MITDILTLTPEFGFQESIEYKTAVTESETGEEVRDALVDDGLREFKLKLDFRAKEAIDTIWDFYIARQGATDDFLIKIITEFAATDEPVGTGDGTTRQFLLDSFPVDISENNTAKLDGVLTTAYALSNDTANEKSYITFTQAPTLGQAITASYEFYFRVRFKDDRLTRELIQHDLLNVGIDLKEVRWNTYFPFSGNSSSSSSSSSAGNIATRWYSICDRLDTGSELQYTTWDGASTVYANELPRIFPAAKVTTKFSIASMHIYLNTAPGVGKKRVFTVYHNDQPTNLTMTISGLSTSGRKNAQVNCENGDLVYLREDQHNTPASTNVNLGFNLRTGDPRKCPVIGPSGYQAWAQMTDNGSSGLSGIFATYPGDGLACHTLITTPGIFRNMQVRVPVTFYSQGGSFPLVPMKLIKKVGTDKFVDQGLSATVTDMQVRGEDATNYCSVAAGDYIGWQSTAYNPLAPQLASIDFLPDNPKESNHGKGNFGHPFSTSADLYDCFHGEDKFLALSARAEPFTICPIAGIIKNITIQSIGVAFVAGFPGTFVIRKNGVDTSLTGTLSNLVSSVVISGTLSVNVGDRISIKAKQIGAAPTYPSGYYLNASTNIGWTFRSTNGGEWPCFSVYSKT
jgi:uncharacterized protein (TIGR02217 family)